MWQRLSTAHNRIRNSLIKILVLALLPLTAIQVVNPSTADALATNSCGLATGTGFDSGDLLIKPLHGKAFYLDLKNGINASYIGYSIENQTNAAIDDLWFSIGDFRSSGANVLSLSNIADQYQPIGSIARGGTAYVYVLVKGSDVTLDDQLHDVEIHKGYPVGNSSIYQSGAAQCFYNFQEVNRIIAASANKVTEILVSDSTPDLGGTLTVTVKGATGQGGSGSASLDGAIMWMSGASSSAWPTRSLRLESTSIAIKYKKTGNTDSFDNRILLTGVNSGGTKFTSATTYTATFNFRVMGGAAVNPLIRPVANIASGTQIKHTGTYPSTNTAINLTSISSSLSSTKSVTSVANAVSNKIRVNYSVTISDSSNTSGKSLDSIVDVPDPLAEFITGTARVVDLSRTSGGALIPDPVDVDPSAAKKFVFGGPFDFNSSGRIVLTYSMNIPTTNGTYSNRVYGLVGGSIVGSSSTTITSCPVTVSNNSGSAGSCTNVATIKQDQSIDFPQFPSLGVGSTFQLGATASSGLDVSYTSTTTSVCTVSGTTLIIISTGSCTIVASQSGDSTTWNAAQNVSRSANTLLGQTITFAPNSRMDSGSSQSVAATSNSGLPVTLTVITTDVCRVTNATSPFTIEAKDTSGTNSFGTCTIVATQAGNGTYGAAAPVERNIFVGAIQVIDWTTKPGDQSVTTGTFDLAATSKTPNIAGTNTNLPIEFTSNTPSVCTTSDTQNVSNSTGLVSGVSANSVTLVSAGICELVATQDGLNGLGNTTAYAPAADVSHVFMVGNRTPDVTISGANSVIAGSTNVYTVSVIAPATYPSSGSLTLSGTVTLSANGWIISSSQIQSSSISGSVSASGSVTATFNVTAIDLPVGSANDQFILTASFTTSNSSVFTSSATESPTNVSVIAPLEPVGTTNDLSIYTTTTATLPGTINSKGSSSATATFLIATSEASLAEDTNLIPSGNYSGNTSSGDTNQNFTANAVNLSPATAYFYRTKATRGSYNGFGSIKRFVTKPAAPTNVSINVSTSPALISFLEVSKSNEVTISYTASCTDGTNTLSGSGNSSPVSVAGMLPNTTYSCTVTANASASGFLGGGAGSPSSAASVTTKKSRTLKIFRSGDQTETSTVQIVYGETLTAAVGVATADDVDAANSDGSKSISVVSGGCSISSFNVSRSSVGTCVIRGNQAQGNNYEAKSTTTDLTIEWIKANVGVSPNIPSVTFGDNLPTISPTYAAGDWKNNENQSNAAGLVAPTCTASGYTSTTPAGTVVTVNCAGGNATNYNFNYTSGSFTVARKNRTISLTTPSASTTSYTDWSVVGPTLVGTASAGDTDGTKRYTTSSSSSVCTVNETSGEVTFAGPGDCVVTTSIDQGNNHNSASSGSTKTLTIGRKNQVLTFADQNLNLSSGTSVSLSSSTNATTNNTGLGNTTYEIDSGSSSTSGCSVTGSTLSFTQAGTCYVKVSKTGNTHWTDANRVAAFVVSAKKSRTLKISRLGSSDTSTVITYGDTLTTSVAIETADDQDASTTNDVSAAEGDGNKSIDIVEGSEICTVSGFDVGHGTVGTCRIRGRISEGTTFEAKDSGSTHLLTIQKANIGVSPNSVSVTYGDSLPSITPNYNPGHFKKNENANSSAFTVGLTPPTCGVAAGSSYSSTTNAGTVVTIVCTGGSATNYNFTHSTGSFTVARRNHSFVFNALSNVTAGAPNQILPEATDQNQPINYSTNDSNICDIVTGSDGRKYVRAKAAGNCEVTASSPQSTNFNAASSSNYNRGFVISAAAKLNRNIEINNSDFSNGIWNITNWAESVKRLTSAASHDDNDNKTYATNSPSSICTVDGSTGDVTFVGAGDCQVSVTIATGNNYNSASSTQTKVLRIGKRNQSISFNTLSAMTVGDSDQTLSSSTDASGLTPTLTVDSSSAGVCEIVSGKIRALSAGTCRVNSNQSGNGNWNPANQEQRSFTINPRPNNNSNSTPAPTPEPEPAPAPTNPTPSVVTKVQVKYNGNGKSDGKEPEPVTVDPGQSVKVAENSGQLKRQGYVLQEWNTAPDGKGTSFKADGSDKIESVNNTVQLYAIWKPITVRVVLEHNDGSDKKITETYTYDGNPVTLPAITNSRKGFDFAGWQETPQGGAIVGTAGETLAPTQEVVLFAKWTEKPAAMVVPKENSRLELTPAALPAVAKLAEKPIFAPAPITNPVVPTVLERAPETIEIRPVTVQAPTPQYGVQMKSDFDWNIAITSTTQMVVGAVNNENNQVAIEPGNTVTSFGEGFKPNSQVDIYVFSTPIWLGSVITDDEGKFKVTLPMPASLASGEHTFQAQGVTKDGFERAVNVPILLLPAKSAPTVKTYTKRVEVFFALNGIKLDRKAIRTLTKAYNSVKSKLTAKSKVTVQVTGWVQPTKVSPNIVFLSTNRAKVVRDYLRNLGLKARYSISAPGHDKYNIPQSRRATAVITWRN